MSTLLPGTATSACCEEKYDTDFDLILFLYIGEIHLFLFSVLTELKVRRSDVVGISEIRFKLANNSPRVGIISTGQIDQAWAGAKLEISIGQSPSYIEQLTGQTNNFRISPHRPGQGSPG